VDQEAESESGHNGGRPRGRGYIRGFPEGRGGSGLVELRACVCSGGPRSASAIARSLRHPDLVRLFVANEEIRMSQRSPLLFQGGDFARHRFSLNSWSSGRLNLRFRISILRCRIRPISKFLPSVPFTTLCGIDQLTLSALYRAISPVRTLCRYTRTKTQHTRMTSITARPAPTISSETDAVPPATIA